MSKGNKENRNFETWGDYLYKKLYYVPSLIIIVGAVAGAMKIYVNDIKTVANYAITFGVVTFFCTYIADDLGLLDCCKSEKLDAEEPTILSELQTN